MPARRGHRRQCCVHLPRDEAPSSISRRRAVLGRPAAGDARPARRSSAGPGSAVFGSMPATDISAGRSPAARAGSLADLIDGRNPAFSPPPPQGDGCLAPRRHKTRLARRDLALAKREDVSMRKLLFATAIVGTARHSAAQWPERDAAAKAIEAAKQFAGSTITVVAEAGLQALLDTQYQRPGMGEADRHQGERRRAALRGDLSEDHSGEAGRYRRL